jgi:uncharacterized protein (TIGR02117 family)
MTGIVRRVLKILIWIVGIIILYVLVMVMVSCIPVNRKDIDSAADISIYIKTNGVHTDIVVPVRTSIKDWSQSIKPENTGYSFADGYVGFGWGDRDFYLNTPQWSDLKVSTALGAIFYMGSSIMHTTFMQDVNESDNCVRIDLSLREYQQLIAYIESGFNFDESGHPIMIPDAAYGSRDSFYEGTGRYSLVYTCNSWTNEGLKAADQKAALWTLTDFGLLQHYR